MIPEDHIRQDYFRRDQNDGITPPDLAKECTYAEHIVRARGRRTRYTSVSLDPTRIRDFGPCLWKLDRGGLQACSVSDEPHVLVEHAQLIAELRAVARDQDKLDRMRALQALRYATSRVEGLIDWRFNAAGIEQKNRFTWVLPRVRAFFSRV